MDWDEDDPLTESQEAAIRAAEEAAYQGRRGGSLSSGNRGAARPAQPAGLAALVAHTSAPMSAPAAAPLVRKRRMPPSLVVQAAAASVGAAPPSAPASAAAATAAAADENLPLACFPGRLRYAFAAYEVDAACQALLASGVKACGFDIEWRVTYQTGVPPRPAALIQLCYAEPSPSAAGSSGQYTCLLLHIAHSGLTPHLRQLLCSPDVLKAGVGVHGDVLKVQRDFGLAMAGAVCLSEQANARLVNASSAAPPGAGSAGAGSDSDCAVATSAACLGGGGGAALAAAPQKWSLAGLVSCLLRLRLEKSQAIRCSNWEARPPLSTVQQRYAATDAWASLRVYEVLSKLPVRVPPQAAVLGVAPPGAAAVHCAAAAKAGLAPLAAADWVPACAALRYLQPAKLAVYQALVQQGLSVAEVAAQRRIQEDSVQGYMAEAMTAGLGYSWSCLGVPMAVLQQVAEVCGQLLGRQLLCEEAGGAASQQQQAQQLEAPVQQQQAQQSEAPVQQQQAQQLEAPVQQQQQPQQLEAPVQQQQQDDAAQVQFAGSKRPPSCSPGSLAAHASCLTDGDDMIAGKCAGDDGSSSSGGGQSVDVLERLLAAGHKLRELKEQHFADISYGQLRLALAHLGRCNPGPWE